MFSQASDTLTESVQFMQFDSCGNLYVYEPGAGCSEVPQKIDQGFTQEDLQLSLDVNCQDDDKQQVWEHYPKIASKDIYKLGLNRGVASMQLRKERRSVCYG